MCFILWGLLGVSNNYFEPGSWQSTDNMLLYARRNYRMENYRYKFEIMHYSA